MYVLDVIGESYSQVMAVINFICFGSLVTCCVIFYATVVLGIFERSYKRSAMSTLIIIIVLIVVNIVMVDYFGIPLLVPPIGTVYFTEFMHIMQYIASFSVVILCGAIFLLAVLGRFDFMYQRNFSTAFIYLIILVVLHFYLEETFGVKLIFPPNLW